MRLYASTHNMTDDIYTEIIKYFFTLCDKVNIYFPNESTPDVLDFKKEFLSTAHIYDLEDELAHLEPKEGFTMIIASLSEEIKALLLNIKTSYHLSFGLIEDVNVVLYIGNDGECVIEMDDTNTLLSNSLFSSFTQI